MAFAAARGVHILPEVDVPGHVHALITAYPEFGVLGKAPGVRQCWGISPHTLNLEDKTFAFLRSVVATLARLFPFHYLHFGGGEEQTCFDTYQKAGPGPDFEPLAICGNLPIEKVYGWQSLDRYPAGLRPGPGALDRRRPREVGKLRQEA